MDIACLVFEGITALDIIGPYEVLARLPGADLRFVAKERGPIRTDNQVLGNRRRPRDRRHHVGRRARRARWVRDREPRARRPGCSSGSARSTRRRRGRRRCAPARCCSPRPGCSRARRRPRTGRRSNGCGVRRDPDVGARRRAGQVRDRGRRVVGHRHGAHARGAHRRRRHRAGDPAVDRVRPATAVRFRFGRQGAEGRARARERRARATPARGERRPVSPRPASCRSPCARA